MTRKRWIINSISPMRKSKIQYPQRCVPFILLALIILGLYFEPYLVSVMVIFVWWIVLPLIIWAIIAFCRSWKLGGPDRYFISPICGLVLLALVLYFVVRVPAYKFHPEEMITHYEKNKTELQGLIGFTQTALDEGQAIYLEFEYGGVSIFHTTDSQHWNVSDSLLNILMKDVGLDKEEFDSIKTQLKSVNCISIDTHFPEYCDIGYKRVGAGKYSYRIYLAPMTEEQRQTAFSDPHFIPYDDRMSLMFGGGAYGPDVFSWKLKDKLQEKYSQREASSSE